MIAKTLLAAGGIVAILATPAFAQATGQERNGHHYSGGPKTEVPHHMGAKEAMGTASAAASAGHHYTGGPATGVPHHMGTKKTK